jgi:hypothetical protein
VKLLGKWRLAAGLAVLAAVPRSAWALDDLLTPRGLGMGGAAIGSANGALGPMLNPAGMTLLKQYTLEAMYGFGVQDLGSTLHAAVVDNVTSRLAAGMYYTFIHGNPKVQYNGYNGTATVLREGHESGLSLALPFGDRFSFGITSKYTTITTQAINPQADQAPADNKSFILDSTTKTATANGFTMDAGLTLRLGDSFNIGLAGYNLVPLNSWDAPLSMGVGASYLYNGAFMLNADVKIDFDKVHDADKKAKTSARFNAGLEYLVGGAVPVRLGVSYDSGLPGTYLSTGVGYAGRSFGIDIAYRQKVQAGTDTLLMAGLRLFLE